MLRYGDNVLKIGCFDVVWEGFFIYFIVVGCKGWWYGFKNFRVWFFFVGVMCGDDVGNWGCFCN